tara:strand:- start:61656 stop:61775 length:120 start_codon:yes stop_codon:yes gene_type:complete
MVKLLKFIVLVLIRFFKFTIEASKSTPTTKMHKKPEILT